jgi:hypothetical protein
MVTLIKRFKEVSRQDPGADVEFRLAFSHFGRL